MKKKRIMIGSFRRCDVAALLLCVFVFAFLLWSAPRGMGTPDENFYFTIPQRLLKGDRLLADEWQVTQFSALLQLLPYSVFTRIAAGTEGIVLYFRYLYIFCAFCIYWFLHACLRRYGAPAVIANALFALYSTNTIGTLNYYTMALQGLAVCCALLFCGAKKPGAVRCLFAGFVFGCVVLAQPPLILLWCVPTAAAVYGRLQAKRGCARKEAESGRMILFSTLGAVFCAAAVFVYLLVSGSFTGLSSTISSLATDASHSFLRAKNGAFLPAQKLASAAHLYGTGWMILSGAAAALCLVFRLFLRNRRTLRFILFLFLCGAVCGTFLHAAAYCITQINAANAFPFHSFPLLLFCAGILPLSEKRGPGLSAFAAAGFAASVCVDLTSNILLGFGGVLTLFCAVPCLAEIASELRTYLAEIKKNRLRRLLKCVLSAALAVFIIGFASWQSLQIFARITPIYEQAVNQVQKYSGIPLDDSLSVKLERGPLKGTVTTLFLSRNYYATLADLDEIRDQCSGAFCAASPYGYMYLYADLPYGTYSAYYDEANAAERLDRYWALHPEKKAQYLYFPREYTVIKFPFPADAVAEFSKNHDCTAKKGRAGYIVKLN